MNADQKARLETIANAILGALSVVNPVAGAAGKAIADVVLADNLFNLGAQYSDVLAEIRAETDATADQVGGDVSAAYAVNRDKMLASFAAHPGA